MHVASMQRRMCEFQPNFLNIKENCEFRHMPFGYRNMIPFPLSEQYINNRQPAILLCGKIDLHHIAGRQFPA